MVREAARTLVVDQHPCEAARGISYFPLLVPESLLQREGERPAFDTGIAPVVGSAHNFIHVFEFQGKSGEIPALSRNRVPRKG